MLHILGGFEAIGHKSPPSEWIIKQLEGNWKDQGTSGNLQQ